MLKTQAIVIKEVNYRDNDKMLTLFSPEHGKVDALSRGCRKSTSKLLAYSQLFICGDFQFSSSKNRLYLSGCEIAHSFFDLRSDYQKLFISQLFLEITGAYVMPDQPDMPLYYLLINALFALETEQNPPTYIMLFFLLKCADAIGLRPEVTACVSCGKKTAHYLEIESGGLVCADCKPKLSSRSIRLSIEEIHEIQKILNMQSKKVREKADFIPTERLMRFFVDYLEEKTDHRFKTYRTLKEISNS